MSNETLKAQNDNLEQILNIDYKSLRNQKLTELYQANKDYKNLPYETQYALSLINILDSGTQSGDRTGVGTKRIQSEKITIDLTKEFPAVVGKKVHPRGALVEMMWIMSGRTDIEFLRDNGVNYWDSWVKPDGTLGPIYGEQMRNFLGVDQLQNVVDEILRNPDSRRLMVSLWNPAQLKDQALECCHHDYQICSFVDHDGIRKLDLHLKQRSADSFLGIPYDFMLFAYYLHFISIATGIQVNHIHISMADYHRYNNHEEQIREYLNNYFNDPENKFHFNIEYYQSFDKFTRPQLEFDQDLLNEFHRTVTDGNRIDLLIDLVIQHNFTDVVKINNYTEDHHYAMVKAKVAV